MLVSDLHRAFGRLGACIWPLLHLRLHSSSRAASTQVRRCLAGRVLQRS